MNSLLQNQMFRWAFTLVVILLLAVGAYIYFALLDPHQQALAIVPTVLLAVGLVSLRIMVEFTRY